VIPYNALNLKLANFQTPCIINVILLLLLDVTGVGGKFPSVGQTVLLLPNLRYYVLPSYYRAITPLENNAPGPGEPESSPTVKN
jgi:hypothetical protein